jgi:hypothetical protein
MVTYAKGLYPFEGGYLISLRSRTVGLSCALNAQSFDEILRPNPKRVGQLLQNLDTWTVNSAL